MADFPFNSGEKYEGKYSGTDWAVTGYDDNTALRPQFWASVLQANLTKKLVAMDITTSQLERELVQGRSINMPYFRKPKSKKYDPGTALEYENLGAEDDLLHVNKAEYLALELDDIQDLQSPYGQQMFRDSILTPLAESFDADILKHAIDSQLHDGDGIDEKPDGTPSKIIVEDLAVIDGGTYDPTNSDHAPLDAADGDNIYKMFSRAKRTLGENDADLENLFVVVPHFIHEIAENTLVDKGYRVSDDTIINGKVARLMGIDIYVSNNFTRISDSDLNGSDDGYFILFGQKNAINMVTQAQPTVEIIDTPETSFSTLFKAKQVWGSKVFENDKDRLVSALVKAA